MTEPPLPDDQQDEPRGITNLFGDVLGNIWDEDDADESELQQLGPYRILRLLGEGGMGTVYLAEQDSPKRFVALKVIRAGLASEEMQRRFLLEAEALGRLQHPGIAQIYSAGTAGTGSGTQPYFAMEYVAGRPLLDFAKDLELHQRLDLLTKICDAVQHAHRRGIIHRDLKPGNILVDEAGQPKILDFGLARITDTDIHATQQTNIGQIIGTLAYMSPEQALGDPLALDTRTDVYALGAILYELLAGKLPHTLHRVMLQEALRVIREEEPAPLSSINRSYRGDIEIIVAKALEKDKERRYGSAGDLAEDIKRHLRSEPIIARPPSALYQLQKFTQRNRVLVSASVVLLLAVTAGGIASTWQAIRATKAERLAVEQSQRASAAEKEARTQALTATGQRNAAIAAENIATQQRNLALAEKQRADAASAASGAVNEFLRKDILAQAEITNQLAAGNAPDPEMKVRTALDRAVQKIPSRFATQPAVEAELHKTIGDSYQSLGVRVEARKQLEAELALRQRLHGPYHPETLDCLNRLNRLLLDEGKYDDAFRATQQTLQRIERVTKPGDELRLQARDTLGAAEIKVGKFPDAIELYKGLAATRKATNGVDSPLTIAAMAGLAVAYEGDRRFEDVILQLRPIIAFEARTLGAEHPETLNSKIHLARALDERQQWAEAEPLANSVLDAHRRLRGPDHPVTIDTMTVLAGIYRKSGKYDEALELSKEIYQRRLRILGPDHPDTIAAHSNIAAVYSYMHRLPESIEIFKQVLDDRRRILGPDHTLTIVSLMNIAVTCAKDHDYAAAEGWYQQSLDASRRQKNPIFNNIISGMNGLQGMAYRRGDYTRAEAMEKEIIEYRRKVRAFQPGRILNEQIILAEIYYKEQRYTECETLVRSVLEAESKLKKDEVHMDGLFQSVAKSLLGGVMARTNRLEEGRPLLLAAYQELLGMKNEIIELEQFYITDAKNRVDEFVK